MPYFAPNKYVIKTDKKGNDYHEFSNLPDLERIIEVTEAQANQVMRSQSQWIEVNKEIKQEINHENHENHEKEVKDAPQATKEVLIKKLGRPKK
jgi:hypothetical protein